MLHAVQPSSCDGTDGRSCSPAMWVALGMCPLFHSDSHRLRDKIDVVCSWRPRGGLGLRQAGSVHVHHDRKEAVVELLVEVLHRERRVGAEGRRAERKQHLVSLPLGLELGGRAIGGEPTRQASVVLAIAHAVLASVPCWQQVINADKEKS